MCFLSTASFTAGSMFLLIWLAYIANTSLLNRVKMPVVGKDCNAMFSPPVPAEMAFDRGLPGKSVVDGKNKCNFLWVSHTWPRPLFEASNV